MQTLSSSIDDNFFVRLRSFLLLAGLSVFTFKKILISLAAPAILR